MPWLFIGVAVAAIAYFTTIGSTAKAAKDLMYNFRNAKIHKFASGGEMIVRLFVDFTNLHDTPILIQSAKLDVKLDNITVGICYLENIQIVKGVNHKYFDLEMPWINLAFGAGQKLIDWFDTGTLTPPDKATVTGQLMVEDILIPIEYTIPFSSESDETSKKD